MDNQSYDSFAKDNEAVLKSIKIRRIVLPVLIGIVAVSYLLFRQFNWQEFQQIEWTQNTLFWVLLALLALVVHHLAYSIRIYLLAAGEFSFLKCIELIFIWEFSSAVSPSAVGGSTVAFFVLAQEKVSLARSTTIVLYTIVLDGIFYLLLLPIFFLLVGPEMIRPNLAGIGDAGIWGYYFIITFTIMLVYTGLFIYGLLINPLQLKRLLSMVTKLKFLKRYHLKAVELGDEMIIASGELKQRSIFIHLGAFLATIIAWSTRFLMLNILIIAFIPGIPVDFWFQFGLFTRLMAMYFILLFSPTPGGAGFIEIFFGGFLTDYVSSPTISTVIAAIWRLISYYFYLLAGVLVVPNWLRKILNERRKRKIEV